MGVHGWTILWLPIGGYHVLDVAMLVDLPPARNKQETNGEINFRSIIQSFFLHISFVFLGNHIYFFSFCFISWLKYLRGNVNLYISPLVRYDPYSPTKHINKNQMRYVHISKVFASIWNLWYGGLVFKGNNSGK